MIVFDAVLDRKKLDFGAAGRLRKSDLLMYDRQTKRLVQQFTREALIGELTEKRLKIIPARLEPWDNFVQSTLEDSYSRK